MTGIRTIGAIAFAALAMLTSTAVNACVIVSLSGQTEVNYDVSSGIPEVRNLQLRFERTCAEEAMPGDLQIEFWFSDDLQPQPYAEIGGVPFSIRRQSTSLLSTPVAPLFNEPIYTLRGAVGVLDIDLFLAAGVASRNDVREISLNWRTQNEAGDVVEFSNPVLLSLVTLPSFAISLDSGGGTGALNFGTLVPGDRRSVGISATATHPFRIELDSTYGSFLRRVDVCGAPLETKNDLRDSVPITASLDGRPISETQAYVNSSPTGASVMALANLDFEVKIDPTYSPEQTRAGRYCNVLTLTILPAN